jgi:uncharacterized protein (DUF2235 family)
MPKKIVLCCDGTNNQFSGYQTNVIRAVKVGRYSADQVKFYHCGVGTMPEPWMDNWFSKTWSIVAGLACGHGFEQNIADAYQFLMSSYEPGDLVYLFGFSRGAFTARALAAMLHSVGLMRPGMESMIRYAQRYWLTDFGPNSVGGKNCTDFRQSLSRPCPIHFIGVWDTVSSIGIINNFSDFPHTLHNPEVSHVRHAVSIDERRSCFRQNLMFKAYPDQDIKNVWFPGVHSDVGGGYPPAESGLAKIAFEWIMREAQKCEMEIDPQIMQQQMTGAGAPPDPCAEQHESLEGLWWLVELIPMKRYNWERKETEWQWSFGRRRNVCRDADKPEVFMHQSVIDRMKCRPGYRPPNIPQTEEEIRKIFKIES